MDPEPPPRPKRRPATSWQEVLRDAGPYMGLGMQVGLGLVFFVGLGYLLDRWLGTLPWFMLAGGLVGMVAVFIYLIRASQAMGRRSEAERRPDGGDAPPPR
ncbi:MAG: AtpZ/AtpI family protein [Rhodothermales bacterium]|nr:AtpZ/AtpI family protein [Rhodothermales bacterium]